MSPSLGARTKKIFVFTLKILIRLENIEVIDLEMLIMQLSNLIYTVMLMLVHPQQEQFL